jgi:ADP-ribose pyrophosphatase YjhB (NUDIX family)
MRVFKFCPLCAHPLEEEFIDHKVRARCPSCDFVNYMNPAPAAGVILVEDGKVLLVRRKFEPKRGMWSIPAGFIEADEDVRECAVREMKEETNLDVELDELFDVYSAFDDPRTSALLVLFTGRRTGGELVCGDDASEAGFFPLEDLPEEIAFRAHRKALEEAGERLARRSPLNRRERRP